jgi:hypothetical protein
MDNRCPILQAFSPSRFLKFPTPQKHQSRTRVIPWSKSRLILPLILPRIRNPHFTPDCNTKQPHHVHSHFRRFRGLMLHHKQNARRVRDRGRYTTWLVRPAIMPVLRHCGSHACFERHMWLNRKPDILTGHDAADDCV